jgi:hypothetical protein
MLTFGHEYVDRGIAVSVGVNASTVYEIDLDGFTLPSGLAFGKYCDLTVGQAVQIQLLAAPTALSSNAISLSTSRVRLTESVVSGTVTTPAPSGLPLVFTLGSLPPIFGSGAPFKLTTLPLYCHPLLRRTCSAVS